MSSLGAPDQQARVDAERIADDADHHDGADAEPAPAHADRKTTTSAPAAVATTILDIVALRQIVVAHPSSPRRPRSVSPTPAAKSIGAAVS